MSQKYIVNEILTWDWTVGKVRERLSNISYRIGHWETKTQLHREWTIMLEPCSENYKKQPQTLPQQIHVQGTESDGVV